MRKESLSREAYAHLIDEYVDGIKHSKKLCPVCSSPNIQESLPDRDGLSLDTFLDCACGFCRESWREYYSVYDIELRSDSGDLIPIDEVPLHSSEGTDMKQVTLYQWPPAELCLGCIHGVLVPQQNAMLCMRSSTLNNGKSCRDREEKVNSDEE